MSKAGTSQIHFAQTVEKQKACSNDRVLELAFYKGERRQPADLEQAAALGAALEQSNSLFRRKWRGLAFRQQDIFEDGNKFIAPSPKGRGVFGAEARK